MNIGWVTCARFPNGFEREDGVVARLRAAGHEVTPWVWTLPAPVDYDLVIVRSPWDYHLHAARWFAWLDGLTVRCLNPVDVLRWNSDKSYLLELGVPIVPTVIASRGMSLAAAMGDWADVVVKPVISASAHRTWRTGPGAEPSASALRDPIRAEPSASALRDPIRAEPSASALRDPIRAEERFEAELALSNLLVQPFLPEVLETGEWSLVFIDLEFSHAVLKRPKGGDFRSQEEYGSRLQRLDPPDFVLAAARNALAGAPIREHLLYARVDGVVREGEFYLMELELVDPTLFLEHEEGAAARFAEAILRELE